MTRKRHPVLSPLLTALVAYLLLCAAVFFLQGWLVFAPNRTLDRTPEDLGIPFRSPELSTSDGVRLSAWLLAADEPRGALVFCHGNAGNISDRIEAARVFRNMGLSVLLFDYRGYGASNGSPSEDGLYLDAEAAFDYLVEREGFAPEKIAVYGESLGGGVAVHLARHRRVACTITESTFTSIPELGAEIYPWLPVSILARIRFDNAAKVGDLSAPYMIVHSETDRTIPFSHAEQLRERADPSSEFLITGGDHNDGGFMLSTEWRERVQEFLWKALPVETPGATVESR